MDNSKIYKISKKSMTTLNSNAYSQTQEVLMLLKDLGAPVMGYTFLSANIVQYSWSQWSDNDTLYFSVVFNEEN